MPGQNTAPLHDAITTAEPYVLTDGRTPHKQKGIIQNSSFNLWNFKCQDRTPATVPDADYEQLNGMFYETREHTNKHDIIQNLLSIYANHNTRTEHRPHAPVPDAITQLTAGSMQAGTRQTRGTCRPKSSS
ncbi:hypothetical protein AVEN_58899-1 [Araneus ventricosus]|uniref:Uncharacterized protein n=1 Tax=Araneus ventricosus TaxID=182803 RepID=A0A4Y2JP80_ARAVE|nr:hypothetical protein AVEN_58899-1 [Araneus ventricosus]